MAYGLLALSMLVGAVVWLGASESALRWSVRQAEAMSAGALTLRDLHGSLLGPMTIGELSYRSETRQFDLKQLTIDWSPLALLQRHVDITRFVLEELRVSQIKSDSEPPVLPTSLALPVSVALVANIRRVVLDAGGRQEVLEDVDFDIDKRTDEYRLRLRNVTTAWGVAQGQLQVGEAAPFPVAGAIALRQEAKPGYAVNTEVAGNLDLLVFKAAAEAAGGTAGIDASIAPLSPMPLVRASGVVENIDPALLHKALPNARLRGTFAVARQDAGHDGDIVGDIAISNEQPGPWDRARLPVRRVALRLAGPIEQLDIRDIELDLAGAGRFVGEGQIKEGLLRLALTTGAFNPHGVHTKARALRLAGDIRLQASAESQSVSAKLTYQGFRLGLNAHHQDAVLTVAEATLRSDLGSLSVHGTLGLTGRQPLHAAGVLRGFNPADFGNFPTAKVNATFTASGHLAGEPEGTLAFAIADSSYRRQPLSGQGDLSFSAKRIWDSTLRLQLAGNRLELNGAFGQAGDRMTFDLDASQLGLVDPRLRGQLRATGDVEGEVSAPSGNVNIEAHDLAWNTAYHIAHLRAGGRMARGLDGPFALDIGVQGVTAPRFALDQASVQGEGTRGRHAFDLAARNSHFDVGGRIAGAWHDESGWSGQITQLRNLGIHRFALDAPARLEFGNQRLLLSGARLEFAGANFLLDELDYNKGQLSSRGGFHGLPLAALLGLLQDTNHIETDVMLAGDWRIAATETVEGHLALYRERGDVVVGAPQVGLGLSELALRLMAKDSRVQAELVAVGGKLGRLRADGHTTLSRRNGTWGIAGDAPLAVDVDLAVDSLASTQAILAPDGTLVFDGAVRAALAVRGSMAEPKMTGSISGRELEFTMPDQGLRLSSGRFEAELVDRLLHLKNLDLRSGSGTLTGKGHLSFEADTPNAQVSLKADKLELLSRPDRQLRFSGTGNATLTADKAINIVAKLKVDRALIELPKSDSPAPSTDVVVLGGVATPEPTRPPYPVSFDLDLDLGEHFFLRGKGLDAQLGGAVKLTSARNGLPASRGSIHVVKGAYSAYGQRLDIDRGILNFQGPLDNPGLNIVALRKNQQVEAGVAVSGTAQSPQVRLVSSPSVSDTEKLSWLVLGHGLDDSSQQEFALLQAAAGAVLAAGQSVTLQQRIARAAGLDEVSLKGEGGLEESVLTLGKRLSSRAYLSYEQSLVGAGTVAKLNYDLTKQLSVRAQAGGVAALDIFYSFSFD